MTHLTKAKSKTKIKYNKNLVSNYHLNGEEKKIRAQIGQI